jgi:hypothetical protein
MDELLLTPATFRAILDDAQAKAKKGRLSLNAVLFTGLPPNRISRTYLWAAYWAPDGEL